ncbi:MAG: large repetitive protein, partial [Chloroflexota bacterium]|nr:large repetitive protein [Chloroflexota bacterium]
AYVDTYADATDTCAQQAPAACKFRAWGVADWAQRAGQGALYDWVVANAVLPAVDDRYTDLRKIDRTTVLDIGEIADQYAVIQNKLDNADKGANPLGMAPDALLFDLDPALTKTTPSSDAQTHFEQVYYRATEVMESALKFFDWANEKKVALRDSQNSQVDFVHQVVDEDRDLVNELIDIFGTPYADDIGVNGTYPAGYEGPDIYNHDLTDRTTLTDFQKRCTQAQIANNLCLPETKTYSIQYTAMDCLGAYVTYTSQSDVTNGTLCYKTITGTKSIQYTVGSGLDAGYGRFMPGTWNGTRRVSGDISTKLKAVYTARANYELAITQYQNLVDAIVVAEQSIQDRAQVLTKEGKLSKDAASKAQGLRTAIARYQVAAQTMSLAAGLAWNAAAEAGQECFPKVLGFSNDATSGGRCALKFIGVALQGVFNAFEIGFTSAATFRENDVTAIEEKLQNDIFASEADYEIRAMGGEFQNLVRQEKELRIQLLMAQNEVSNTQTDYLNAVQLGFRKLKELAVKRQRWAGQISEQRYGDMAYRTFQLDALQKYRQEFDLTQLYTYLAAVAYDYETNLTGDDPVNGRQFVRQIIGLRALGEVRYKEDGSVLWPIPGSRGLAGPMGQMRDNMLVLKGQMGFNNPQPELNSFSLRRELFRLNDTSDVKWRQELQRYYTPDIYSNDDVARLAKRPYGQTGPVPGLVIPFGTTIRDGLNFFGLPLGPGDSAYSVAQFATKIASMGIWFDGYDTSRLANNPRVYLLPAGKDVVRPRQADGQLRYWNVVEQLLPLPYPISNNDLQNPDWLARVNGLNGQLFATKPYADMRAYPYSEDIAADEFNTDTRIIGRSVWNTKWLLVIPGSTLLADRQVGIERFIQDVDDIYVYLQIYAYAGTAATQAQAEAKAEAKVKAKPASTSTLTSTSTSTSASASPLPLPDALFYGVVTANDEPLEAGTVKAILPRGAVVNVDVTPIRGTDYTYALNVPLSQYDPDLGVYADDSARPGETIRFLINDTPATFRNASGATTDQFVIPANGMGQANWLDLALVGPSSYPVGDVNTDGARNSADALLILKYDVGLLSGDANFPPAPGKIYLPLCDIVQNGKCNSGDALRVLQCDVQMPGVSCPNQPTVAVTAVRQQSRDPLAPAFRVEISRTAASDRVVVRVRGGDSRARLAATALDVGFATDRLTLESCTPAATGLDGGYCNATFGQGLARLVVVAVAGIAGDQPLAELTFRLPVGVRFSDAELGAAFNLTAHGVYDGAGKALGWRTLPPQVTPQPGSHLSIYLPMVSNGCAAPACQSGTAPPDSRLRLYLPFVLRR